MKKYCPEWALSFALWLLPVLSAASPLDPNASFACAPDSAVACSGLFPIHRAEDSTVALLTNGEASLAARIALLRKARRSIRIQALIFTGDESGLYIAELLKEKKRAGLDVRVIVDSVSNLTGTNQASKVLGWQTQWMYYDLKQHGIEVEGYESLYLGWVNEVDPLDPLLVNKRFHDKMWVVDAEEPTGAAIIGGMNIANEYFRVALTPAQRWRDQDVLVRGPVVQDTASAFDRNYAFFKSIKASRPELFNTDKAWKNWRQNVITNFGKFKIPYSLDRRLKAQVEKIVAAAAPLPEGSPATTRFIQNRPRLSETFIRQAYLKLIEAAREEILIANAYFVPKGELLAALGAAATRGVKVTILTNSLETNDLPQLSHVSRYYYQDLLRFGVQVYEWLGAKFSEGTIHAKFAVFDRRAAIVGSYNLDPRSDLLNSETVLAFESPVLAGELADQFVKQDLARSARITPEQAKDFHNPGELRKQFDLLFSLPLTDWL